MVKHRPGRMRTSLSFRQRRRCRRNPRCSPPTRLSLGWRGLAKTSPVLKLALRLRLPGWNEYIATFLIGHGCSLDYIEPCSRHKEDTRDLSLSAWIADPSAIPKVKWLTPTRRRAELRHRVIIHVDLHEDHSKAADDDENPPPPDVHEFS
ncbi:hypothetical protein ZWY2020_037089 [Hordeum vulgare]|nr:hypothetical protein ZWY2020_037089 [Hordeum vulgare]